MASLRSLPAFVPPRNDPQESSLSVILAELWRAKRVCGAPWVSKYTHPRKFGNHVTVHRPPVARPSAPQGNQCLIPHLLASLGAQEDWYCTHIVHQCCDQLTAVKTGYPLTSITWPYRGIRCRPIEVEYFFKVIRWQVTSFQMIAGSSLIFLKFILWREANPAGTPLSKSREKV